MSISAQNDIAHLTRANNGTLVADSSRELPNNWLYRRGFVDSTTGTVWRRHPRIAQRHRLDHLVDRLQQFLRRHRHARRRQHRPHRRAQHQQCRRGRADECAHAEGCAERGQPSRTRRRQPRGARGERSRRGCLLRRARSRHARCRRHDPHQQHALAFPLSIVNPAEIYAPETWLPTTLFLGKGVFDVSARGDLLLGPTANPFLLPQGVNNTFWYKTYFSTYAADSAVHVSSLTGDVTLRESANSARGRCRHRNPTAASVARPRFAL